MKSFYSGEKLLLLNLALGLGTFIQILDSSITNVSIPYIAGSLSVTPEEGTWVITSFAVSNAIVLPLTGWLADYFGRVRLFVYSVLLFTIASFFCGLAHNLTALVIARVFQGAVAGSLIPLSQSLIMSSNPTSKQGGALGFWAMIVIVAPLLGPMVGGYITQIYSWPWIFYINVPIGLFSCYTVWTLLKDQESKIVRNPIDWVGLTLLAIGVGCLQILLDKGRDLDWFSSEIIVTLAVVSVVALAYFGVWNSYAKFPIVDLSFFKDRNFMVGTIIITVGFFLFFTNTIIIPLWLQTVQGYTPIWAGIAVAPIGIFPILLSPLLGLNLHRFDLRFVAALSFLLFSLSFFYQAQFVSQVDLGQIMLVRLFQGMGVAFFFIPLVQISLANVPQEKYASASGLFNFIRILFGSGFGTSLSVFFWTNRGVYYHSHLVEPINYYNPTIQGLFSQFSYLATSGSRGVMDFMVDGLVQKESYMMALNDMAWIGAWLFLVMVPLPFLCKRVRVTKFLLND